MTTQAIRRYLKHGTLPQLRVFEASVRLGSLARAAEELHMAPPTASVQIKKLSETVGSPLLEQVGKRMYPTDVGRRVYEGCGEVFRAFDALEEALHDMRTLDAGELRIAVTTTARYFAPRLLGAFAQRHPGIRTAMHVANSAELAERLHRNEDDVYLVADMPATADVVAQSVVANPLVVMARADHPLAGERGIPFRLFAREPFLMREPGSGTRAAALRAFAAHGLAPRTRMELGSNEAIREAILAGMGVAILSRYTLGIEAPPAGLACLDVDGFPIESHWQFAYPLGKHLSAAARSFLEFARAQARTLAREAPGT
ncbi:LysR substrate-binding domain-containing protein [Ramlibacter sp.]|uniref:LysR substrate-binding domain-containing protein n=1 Tax=Ramlibacter sp. TaxID=1917967 RepID=UPI002BFE60FB|nr:LysR substrate-binding domain-containing protein [Ramlibacter sp.]HWI80842.1 LysR substrate-binding domain-containing protein [Ramlibacter sp.]